MSLPRGALRECINYDMDHDEGIKMVTLQWLVTTSLRLASVDEDDLYSANSKNSDRLDLPSCIDRKLRLWNDCSLLDQNRLHPYTHTSAFNSSVQRNLSLLQCLISKPKKPSATQSWSEVFGVVFEFCKSVHSACESS